MAEQSYANHTRLARQRSNEFQLLAENMVGRERTLSSEARSAESAERGVSRALDTELCGVVGEIAGLTRTLSGTHVLDVPVLGVNGMERFLFKRIGLPEPRAREYAAGLIGAGCDTLSEFKALSAEQLAEHQFRPGHVKKVLKVLKEREAQRAEVAAVWENPTAGEGQAEREAQNAFTLDPLRAASTHPTAADEVLTPPTAAFEDLSAWVKYRSQQSPSPSPSPAQPTISPARLCERFSSIFPVFLLHPTSTSILLLFDPLLLRFARLYSPPQASLL